MYFGSTLILVSRRVQKDRVRGRREKMFPVINLSWSGTNGEISFRTLTPDGGTFAKSSGHYYSPFRLTSEEQKKKNKIKFKKIGHTHFNDLLYYMGINIYIRICIYKCIVKCSFIVDVYSIYRYIYKHSIEYRRAVFRVCKTLEPYMFREPLIHWLLFLVIHF